MSVLTLISMPLNIIISFFIVRTFCWLNPLLGLYNEKKLLLVVFHNEHNIHPMLSIVRFWLARHFPQRAYDLEYGARFCELHFE